MTFKDWWTGENNPALPKEVYLYGTRHITVLIITLIACVLLTAVFMKRGKKTKRILCIVLGSIFLFFEIASRVVNLITEDTSTWQNVLKILLPMHICSVMVWAMILGVFTKKQWLLNFAVIGGIMATLAFLLYPAVGLNRTFITFSSFYSIFTHMLGFITAIISMTLGIVKFEFKRLWITYLCFVVMFCWGAILYFAIFPGSDYMYIVEDPLELDIKFPYQIIYAAILVIYIFAFYLAAWTITKIRSRKTIVKSNK